MLNKRLYDINLSSSNVKIYISSVQVKCVGLIYLKVICITVTFCEFRSIESTGQDFGVKAGISWGPHSMDDQASINKALI